MASALKVDSNQLSSVKQYDDHASQTKSDDDNKSSNKNHHIPPQNQELGRGETGGPNDHQDQLKVAPTTRVINESNEVSRLAEPEDLLQLFKAFSDSVKEQTHNNGTNSQILSKTYRFPRLLIEENVSGKQYLTPFVLQPSLFHNNLVPPTIYFNSKLTDDCRSPICLPKCLQKLLKWKSTTITPNSIRSCILFSKIDLDKTKNSTGHIGSWCKHMLTADFSSIDDWTKVNHFPGGFNLGRKDKLWLRLKLAQSRFGLDEFNFHPRTFILPKDYDELKEYWSTADAKLFIMKPPASSRGNGIKVINDISQIPQSAIDVPDANSKKSSLIVQQYISNPCLLENGHKFDLRIYVLLTSIEPLRLYIYKEGLVRFASSKYSTQDDGIIDQYMHLTNYFINKNSLEYKINNDCNSLHGSKWTLSTFWAHMQKNHSHINTDRLWSQIVDIIVKSVICCEGPIGRFSRNNCKNDYNSYEIFGFDIILDENFKPWILEVNITPSLKSESDLDRQVKYRVIKDMLNLVGYNLGPSASDGLEIPISPFCFDKRLYSENLTKLDKHKHQRFYKSSRHEISEEDVESEVDNKESSPIKNSLKDRNKYESILDNLTQNDIRILMLSEDELTRKGDFIRVFPSNKSHKYLKYFEKPRYYNQLLDAWEQNYKHRRQEGVVYLSERANIFQ